jgi:hypothetical protein
MLAENPADYSFASLGPMVSSLTNRVDAVVFSHVIEKRLFMEQGFCNLVDFN